MKKYLYDYIKEIDNKLEGDISKEDIDKHLIKIGFFEHERLIHLLVTLAYAIMAIMSYVAAIREPMYVFIGIILTLFLVPYVLHYFRLENGVQYLYKQYDGMVEKCEKH